MEYPIGVFPVKTSDCGLAQVLANQKDGDEGNRTLIPAMRPPCAPVTPRPRENRKLHSMFYRLNVNREFSGFPGIVRMGQNCQRSKDTMCSRGSRRCSLGVSAA